jgi:DNA-binding NarL/FixJ family response regulator
MQDPPVTSSWPAARARPADAAPAEVTVLVVGDVRLYRDGVAGVLAARERVRVVGVADGAAEAMALARDERPRVVLFDVATPGMLDAAREIGRASGAALVAFAVRDTERAVTACAEAGLAGYVTCAGTFDELAAAVRAVARGEVACGPHMAGALFRRVGVLAGERRADAPDEHGTEELTGREREIAALLERGLSNKEIARALGIEVATVKNHVHHILDKLQVARRGEAAARVRRSLAAPNYAPPPAPDAASRS